MWVETFAIRLGRWWLGVGVDTPDAAAAVRPVLTPFLAADAPADLPVACSLRAGAHAAAASAGGGSGAAARPARSLYLVRFGSQVVGRLRSLDDAVDRLAWWLGGLLARQDRATPTLGGRVFVRDGRAVLAAVARPSLVDDRRLADAGIVEVPTGVVHLEPGPSPRLHVPARIDGAAHVPLTVDLVAVVVPASPDGSAATPFTSALALQHHRVTAPWFAVVRDLWDQGRVVPATGLAGVRTELGRLLA